MTLLAGQDLVGKLRMRREDAAPQEGAAVERHRRPVQLDGAQQRGLARAARAPRCQAMPSSSVFTDLRRAEQVLGQRRCRAASVSAPASTTRSMARRCRPAIDRAGRGRAGSRRRLAGRDCRSRPRPARSAPAHPADAPTARSAASSTSASPFGMRTTSSARIGDLHMRDDGAVLLREPGEIERADLRALEMRGHGDDRARRSRCRRRRCRRTARARDGRARAIGGSGRAAPSSVSRASQTLHRRGLPGGAAVLDGDEARAEALEAGEVGVAARRADAALAAVFGLDRLDGDAVGLHGAVAAILADARVDARPASRPAPSCRACGGGASRWRRPGRR